jgi:hypothetical protein
MKTQIWQLFLYAFVFLLCEKPFIRARGRDVLCAIVRLAIEVT